MNPKAILNKETTIEKYNSGNWPFRETIQKILGETELEKLHEKKNYEKFERKNDQSSHWHKKYYDNVETFLSLYRKFIKDVIKGYYPNEEHIVYQRIPTFRVQ